MGALASSRIHAAAMTGLDTSYSTFELTGATAVDAAAKPVPGSGVLGYLSVYINSSTPASLTGYLSHDSGGLYPIGEEVTITLFADAGGTSKKVGSISYEGIPYHLSEDGTKGSLYFHAKLDAGTGIAGELKLTTRSP